MKKQVRWEIAEGHDLVQSKEWITQREHGERGGPSREKSGWDPEHERRTWL